MKNLLIIALVMMASLSIHAQIKDVTNLKNGKLGVKLAAGYITTGSETTMFLNETSLTSQKVKFADATPQYSFGLWGQKKFGWLYTDANILYTSYGMSYEVSGANSDDVNLKVLSEKFNYVDIQVMGGLTSNGFRLGVGPVAHILANHNSDLMNVQYFNERMRKISYGFSGAIGYDFKNFSIDIKFDKAFRTIGDHMYYGTRKSRFQETPDAFTFSVAYSIL